MFLKNFYLILILLPMIVFGIKEPDIQIPSTTLLTSTILTIANWFFYLLIFAAIVSIIFGAWRYIGAKGDQNDIKTAHLYIVYAVIAVVVGMLSKAIVNFVLGIMSSSI